jgi:hypothetical protein
MLTRNFTMRILLFTLFITLFSTATAQQRPNMFSQSHAEVKTIIEQANGDNSELVEGFNTWLSTKTPEKISKVIYHVINSLPSNNAVEIAAREIVIKKTLNFFITFNNHRTNKFGSKVGKFKDEIVYLLKQLSIADQQTLQIEILAYKLPKAIKSDINTVTKQALADAQIAAAQGLVALDH